MRILGMIGRSALALLGVLLAAKVGAALYAAIGHRAGLSPLEAGALMWDVWAASWIAAMVWSRHAAARPTALAELMHWLPTIVGLGLLGFGSIATGFAPLWRLPVAAGWLVAGVCGAGLLFTWWARVSLGSLWSGSVSRKDDHVVIQSGPYRLVRHPIYTGLIAAALAQAALIGMAANFCGALLIAFGLWLKARLEERFLARELGPASYADYRRRTPMLVPFWPVHGELR